MATNVSTRRGDSRGGGAPAWRALLLAGGRSTRMGRDKALLDWHGQPLLTVMRDRLRALGAIEVRISGDYPAWGGIPDRALGLGPLAGLDAALRGAEDGTWLIVPIDMPRLGRTEIESLLGACPEAAALCYAGHALPLRLRLDLRSRDLFARMNAADCAPRERSLRAAHRALDGVELALPPSLAGNLAGCNTPEEWQQALA